ncbi:MAG: hydrogenase nickel incorporation protein HypB [bacterium]|nr:hydrogenase nickel incorporation protein HypB [bacterium]
MRIPVLTNLLEESDALAATNRQTFEAAGVFVVNLMSSPGAGKTTLLAKTIDLLQSRGLRCAVLEGDITSTLDSERLAPLGVPVVQANTEPFGGDCHVGSHFVRAAIEQLPIHELDYLFIENIGNLVCPAEFYLGEHRKVVVLSLPEGEDKPVKYPLMFRECQACLLNKLDLLPYLDVSVPLLRERISTVNGDMIVFPVSAKTGIGLGTWIEWLEHGRQELQARHVGARHDVS